MNTSKRHLIPFLITFFITIVLSVSCSDNKTGNMTYDDFCSTIWDISKNSDEVVVKTKTPSAVLFYTEKSLPCLDIEPITDSLSKLYEDKIEFYKVDAEQEQVLCNSLKINLLPTIILFSKEHKPLVVEGQLPLREYMLIFDKQLGFK